MPKLVLEEMRAGIKWLWYCEPPAWNAVFRVTEDSWWQPKSYPPVRSIFAWEPAEITEEREEHLPEARSD